MNREVEMAKLIRIQKRAWVLVVSLLLTTFHRAAGLISPLNSSGGDEAVSRERTALLFRVAAPLGPSANQPALYYAAELNASFPFVHLQKVLGSPLSVSGGIASSPNLLALSTVSLDDPQSEDVVLYGPAQEAILPPFTNCTSCTDCTSCTSCTSCC